MDRKKLTALLQSNPNITAAILFGSEANGKATQGSDIDIALLYETTHIPKPLDVLQLREELSDQMRQDVDIVLLNDASPIIAMQAIKNGIPLLIRDHKAYNLFEIKLATDYADVKKMREPFEKTILDRKLHD